MRYARSMENLNIHLLLGEGEDGELMAPRTSRQKQDKNLKTNHFLFLGMLRHPDRFIVAQHGCTSLLMSMEYSRSQYLLPCGLGGELLLDLSELARERVVLG